MDTSLGRLCLWNSYPLFTFSIHEICCELFLDLSRFFFRFQPRYFIQNIYCKCKLNKLSCIIRINVISKFFFTHLNCQSTRKKEDKKTYFVSIHISHKKIRSNLLLKSRPKTKQNYILVTSILLRHLVNNFDTLKENEWKIHLITLLWEPSILSLMLLYCFHVSTSTLSWHVLTNNALAIVYIGTPSSLRNKSLWHTFSLMIS